MILIRKNQKRTDEIQICKWSQKHGKQYPGFLNEQIQTELPQIAITFDDGPSVCTPALLDGLKEKRCEGNIFSSRRKC